MQTLKFVNPEESPGRQGGETAERQVKLKNHYDNQDDNDDNEDDHDDNMDGHDDNQKNHDDKGSLAVKKVQFFLTLFKRGGGQTHVQKL